MAAYQKEIEVYKSQIEDLKRENRANVEKNSVLLDKIRSLTDVINKAHATNEDLNKAFEYIHKENMRLKSSTSNSLSLLPENNEMALEKVQNCIQLAGDSISWISQKEKLVHRIKFLERECERYQRDNTTLGKQVRHLVKTLEEERGMIIRRADQVNEYSGGIRTASDVIDQHLITFESIEELQQQNQKLLSLVKEMSKREEERELQVESEESKKLISEIEALKEELEKVRVDREKIMNALNVIHKERDLFKILLGKTSQVEHLTPEVFQRMVSIACSSGPVMGLEAPKDNQDKDAHIADLKSMISKLELEISGLRDEFETDRRRSKEEIVIKSDLLEQAHLNLVNERQKIESLQEKYSIVEDNAKAVMDQFDEARTRIQKMTFQIEQLEKDKKELEKVLEEEKKRGHSEELLHESNRQLENNILILRAELNEARSQSQLIALQVDYLEREKQTVAEALEKEKFLAQLNQAKVLELLRLRNIERQGRLKAQTRLFKLKSRPKVQPKPKSVKSKKRANSDIQERSPISLQKRKIAQLQEPQRTLTQEPIGTPTQEPIRSPRLEVPKATMHEVHKQELQVPQAKVTQATPIPEPLIQEQQVQMVVDQQENSTVEGSTNEKQKVEEKVIRVPKIRLNRGRVYDK